MTMKLSGYHGVSLQNTVSAAYSSVKSEKAESGHAQKTDTLVISREAGCKSEAQGIAKAITNELACADNSEKIASLRNAIATGSYFVSAQDVAGAILGDHLFA